MSETIEAGAREASTISERITHAIGIRTVFTVDLGSVQIPVSDTVVMTWIVMGILLLGSLLLTRRLREVPRGAQALVEWAVDFLYSFVDGTTHHRGRAFAPLIGSIFLFFLTANLLPVLTPVGGFGFEPPFLIRPLARDVNITAAFAVIVILTCILTSFIQKGPVGWLKSFLKPVPFLLPLTILEYLIKPTSLALRLFGNILGAFIVMQLLEMVMPVALPAIAAVYFDLFDGILQAVVFTFLSTIYISEALE